MNDDFLKVAKQAALEAGKVIQKYSGTKPKRQVKDEDLSDLVTDADLEAEKIIVSILTKAFPTHNIITEEKENQNLGSEYSWVIDPLDGTFSFLVGMPFYCVSVGLLKNNQPILGVIFNPSFNELYWAQKGQGAYLNGKLIKVNVRDNLDEGALVLGVGHKLRRPERMERYVLPLINKVGYPYLIGSAAASLVLVAKGILDAHLNIGWVWDFMAGAVIVKEAGGKITDLTGKSIDWTKERIDIIASNGVIHDQILEALR